MISAITKERVIGLNNTLPWHIPEDFKYFKDTTVGKPIIMGRKTFESLDKKPLPNRKNIVITTQAKEIYKDIDNVIVVNNKDEALTACDNAPEVMIIGGANIYTQFLPMADRLYLSIVHKNYPGDTFFPDYSGYNWEEVSKDERDGFTIYILDKKAS